MNFKKLICIVAIVALCPLGLNAQTNDSAQEPYEQIFTDKDKDFLQLWYYEQVLKMQLNEEQRENYLTFLTYYTYKMSALPRPKYGYTEAEQKEKFDDLVKQCNAEMKDLLSPENYEIHYESFNTIVEKVYQAKGWED